MSGTGRPRLRSPTRSDLRVAPIRRRLFAQPSWPHLAPSKRSRFLKPASGSDEHEKFQDLNKSTRDFEAVLIRKAVPATMAAPRRSR